LEKECTRGKNLFFLPSISRRMLPRIPSPCTDSLKRRARTL
jgi:hypothetical protein